MTIRATSSLTPTFPFIVPLAHAEYPLCEGNFEGLQTGTCTAGMCEYVDVDALFLSLAPTPLYIHGDCIEGGVGRQHQVGAYVELAHGRPLPIPVHARNDLYVADWSACICT